MIQAIKKSIASFPEDGLIYLAEKLTEYAGFFVSNKHLLYIVANNDKESSQSISTEYITLNTNVDIHAFAEDQQFKSGKYNILDFIPTEDGYREEDLESFINLCSAHSSYMASKEFVKFFYSLINIFQFPAEQAFRNLVGLFGELTVIKYVYDNYGIDISENWHKSVTDGKYDFVLDGFNVEVKSTLSAEKTVEIKHTQLFNNNTNYLAVVILEKNNAGISVNQLIQNLFNSPLYCNNYNFSINIEKERKRISPTESENVFFAAKEVLFYDAKEINPFSFIPDEVSSLSYRLDLSDKKQAKNIFDRNISNESGEDNENI